MTEKKYTKRKIRKDHRERIADHNSIFAYISKSSFSHECVFAEKTIEAFGGGRGGGCGGKRAWGQDVSNYFIWGNGTNGRT